MTRLPRALPLLIALLIPAPASAQEGWPTAPENQNVDGLGLTGVWEVSVSGPGTALDYWNLEHDAGTGVVGIRRFNGISGAQIGDAWGFGSMSAVFQEAGPFRLEGGRVAIRARLNSYNGGLHDLVLTWIDWNTLAGEYVNENPYSVNEASRPRRRFDVVARRLVPTLNSLEKTTGFTTWDRLDRHPVTAPAIQLAEHRARVEDPFQGGTWLVAQGRDFPLRTLTQQAYPWSLRVDDPHISTNVPYLTAERIVARLDIGDEVTPGYKDVIIGARRFPDAIYIGDGTHTVARTRPSREVWEEAEESLGEEVDEAEVVEEEEEDTEEECCADDPDGPRHLAIVADGGGSNGAYFAEDADEFGLWLVDEGFEVARFSAADTVARTLRGGLRVEPMLVAGVLYETPSFLLAAAAAVDTLRAAGAPDGECCHELVVYMAGHGGGGEFYVTHPVTGTQVAVAPGGRGLPGSPLHLLNNVPSWVHVTWMMDVCGSGGFITRARQQHVCDGSCGMTLIATSEEGCYSPIGNWADSSTDDFMDGEGSLADRYVTMRRAVDGLYVERWLNPDQLGTPQCYRCRREGKEAWGSQGQWGQLCPDTLLDAEAAPDTSPCREAYEEEREALRLEMEQELTRSLDQDSTLLKDLQGQIAVARGELTALRGRITRASQPVEAERDPRTSRCEDIWDRYYRTSEDLSEARRGLIDAITMRSDSLETFYNRRIASLQATLEQQRRAHDECKRADRQANVSLAELRTRERTLVNELAGLSRRMTAVALGAGVNAEAVRAAYAPRFQALEEILRACIGLLRGDEPGGGG